MTSWACVCHLAASLRCLLHCPGTAEPRSRRHPSLCSCVHLYASVHTPHYTGENPDRSAVASCRGGGMLPLSAHVRTCALRKCHADEESTRPSPSTVFYYVQWKRYGYTILPCMWPGRRDGSLSLSTYYSRIAYPAGFWIPLLRAYKVNGRASAL